MTINVIVASVHLHTVCELPHHIQLSVFRALKCGSLWMRAVCLLHIQVLKQTDLQELYLDLTSNVGTENTGAVHIFEVIYQLSIILCNIQQILG
jgi:hypothetical protein